MKAILKSLIAVLMMISVSLPGMLSLGKLPEGKNHVQLYLS